MASITLSNGKQVTLDEKTLQWDVSGVTPEVLAGGLAGIQRFSGMLLPRTYSVAEHSCLLYEITGQPWSLFHDCHEALGFGDISYPFKKILVDGSLYYDLAESLDRALAVHFGVPLVDVSEEDHKLGQAEARWLLGNNDTPKCPRPNCYLLGWKEARDRWLRDFDRVMEALNHAEDESA